MPLKSGVLSVLAESRADGELRLVTPHGSPCCVLQNLAIIKREKLKGGVLIVRNDDHIDDTLEPLSLICSRVQCLQATVIMYI